MPASGIARVTITAPCEVKDAPEPARSPAAANMAMRIPGIAITPSQSAPAISASVPGNVIPPESPAATGRNVRIERGGRRASVPISVAHVSAVAAAYAPANANAQRTSWVGTQATAHAVATPPLASTCNASRGPALPTSTRARLRALPIRESSTDGTKNASRTRVKPSVPLA